MKRFFYTAISREDRLSAIPQLEECINRLGAIVDFKFFSDLSISLIVEIEERNIKPLHEQLQKLLDISDHMEPVSASEQECMLLLNITFSKGTGDMLVAVPAVPG